MIDFYETKLIKNIRKIVLHPDVMPFLFTRTITELSALNLEKLMDPNITIYALRINEKLAGLGFFVKENDHAVVDVCFLPEFRGKDAKDVAMRAISDYVSKKAPKFISGKIRKNNRRSLLFSKWLLFHVERSDNDFFYIRRNYG